MLQIVTKMYFRKGIPLNSTVHRNVLFTNCCFLRGDVIELPVGELAPATAIAPVSTVTVSITEHLEQLEPDGSQAMLVATSGVDLTDDLADVLSFGLNAVFSRNRDLVRRLVPDSVDNSTRTWSSNQFRRTFDAHRYVPDVELDALRGFMTQLLALRRPNYHAAMRAIRRIVRATQRATDDPTGSYVDLVAALESLSAGSDAPAPTWDRLPKEKRDLIDAALVPADAELASGVRQAVMEAEKLGAISRFVGFVMANVSDEYCRGDAIGAELPVRRPQLERIVRHAYQIRSRSVHALAELPPEQWAFGKHETVTPPGVDTMLTHEGLARLARHVVKSYVAGSPVGTDSDFDWRDYLPGKLRMRIAPQYWLWQAEGFNRDTAALYFSGFVGHLAELIAKRQDALPQMDGVLERIEQLAPGTDGPSKAMMVAIYALWHRFAAPSLHRPDPDRLLNKHMRVLQRVELPCFAAGLLLGTWPDWSDEEWLTVATDRRIERSKRRYLELPPGFDAVLQAVVADRLADAGNLDDARAFVGYAIDELPGNETLIAWEASLTINGFAQIDLVALAVQGEPQPSDGATTADVEQAPEAAEPEPPA